MIPHTTLKNKRKKRSPFSLSVDFLLFSPNRLKGAPKKKKKKKALTSSIVTFILKRASGLDIVLFVVMCALAFEKNRTFIFSPLSTSLYSKNISS